MHVLDVRVRGMRREGRSSFWEEEKDARGGCYTSVSDVLNMVSKGRRSILAQYNQGCKKRARPTP